MKYEYKIIGLDHVGRQTTFYKFDTDTPYNFNIGDEIWFPEDWKKELGGGYVWGVKKIQHYPVDNFIAIYASKEQ